MKTNKPQHTQGELKIRINNIGFKLMSSESSFSIAIIENKWRSGDINEANAQRLVEAWNTLEQNKKKLELFEELFNASKKVVETDRKISSTFPSEIMDALRDVLKKAQE